MTMLTLESKADPRNLVEILDRLYSDVINSLRPGYKRNLLWVASHPDNSVSQVSNPVRIQRPAAEPSWAGHHLSEVYKATWTIDGITVVLGSWEPRRRGIQDCPLVIKVTPHTSKDTLHRLFNGLGHLLLPGSMVVTGGTQQDQADFIAMMKSNPPAINIRHPDFRELTPVPA